jgi:hypothetical protein
MKGVFMLKQDLATRPHQDLARRESYPAPTKAPHKKTRITIKYDVGYGNTLFLRGKSANLSWDKGVPMKNMQANEWIWETEVEFPTGEFKVLINDQIYETGPNHPLNYGAIIQYTPRF